MKQIECVVIIDKKMIIKVNAPPREKSVITFVKEMDTRVWTLKLMEAFFMFNNEVQSHDPRGQVGKRTEFGSEDF